MAAGGPAPALPDALRLVPLGTAQATEQDGVVAAWLGKLWGQAVVIENKPGGQNVVGAQAAARSPADGFNFYFVTTAALSTNPLPFKTLADKDLAERIASIGPLVDGSMTVDAVGSFLAAHRLQVSYPTLAAGRLCRRLQA